MLTLYDEQYIIINVNKIRKAEKEMTEQIIEALEAKGFAPRTLESVTGGMNVIANRESSSVQFNIKPDGVITITDIRKFATSGKRTVTDVEGAIKKIKRMRKA